MITRLPTLALIGVVVAIAGCGSSSSKGTSTTTTSSTTTASDTAKEVTASTPASTSASTPTSIGGSGSGKSLSVAQLITRADAVCKQLSAELDLPSNGAHTELQMVTVVPRRAELQQAALTELGKLVPPASIAHDWDEILAVRRALIAESGKIAGYAAEKNKQAVQGVLASSVGNVHRMTIVSHRIGFKYCGEVG
jgi:hypothetical protein